MQWYSYTLARKLFLMLSSVCLQQIEILQYFFYGAILDRPPLMCTVDDCSQLATEWISCGMMRSPANANNNKLGLRKFTCTFNMSEDGIGASAYTLTTKLKQWNQNKRMRIRRTIYERVAKHCYVTQCIAQVIMSYLCSIQRNISLLTWPRRKFHVKFSRILHFWRFCIAIEC